MRVHWGTAIALALPFSAITVFLLSLALRARRNKVETGSEGMIGETGAAVTDTGAGRQDFRSRRILGRGVIAAGRHRCARAGYGHRQVETQSGTAWRSRRLE